LSVLLLSTLHDPEGRLLPLIQRLRAADDPLGAAWAQTRHNYADLLCVASRATDGRSNAALEATGWPVVVQRDEPADRGLWSMVRRGLDRGTDFIHFCDLDRFVHWLLRYPDELQDLPAVWDRADLTMLVRSPRAFATHPPCQTVTEGIANRVIAHRLGMPDADALSGSYVWSRRAAEAIVAFPGPRDLRFYAVGAVAPFRAGCSVNRHVVEGLEWETPDQYPDEIASLGYATWLAQFESPAQWRHRAEMARLWVEVALAT
jgi:hypothetical protein